MTNRNNFSVYLRESEQAKLATLMGATDLSRSGVIRKLIADARVVLVQSATVPPVVMSRETPQQRKARVSESRRHKNAQQDARRESVRLAKQAREAAAVAADKHAAWLRERAPSMSETLRAVLGMDD